AAALEHELSGLEFAGGIPGSLGGACVMNAGAYGGEMKDVLKRVTCLDENHAPVTFEAEELCLGYRSSIFMKRPMVAVSAELELKRGNRDQMIAVMDDFRERRQSKQPLELPSAGSTFKRPEGYFAGKLIMDAGLRGYRIGGAKVSEKHCGFIVNDGDACAADVLALIRHVRKTVAEQFGVQLEPEVRLVGSFREEDSCGL
ncbi:MAG: UDP-N-acetylmuramate dehydrogenase, partial [Clostridia bacterium]|nr:UDP-N-acetylmuramate dehydrogenase [Clostridia bacterium]